MSMKSDAEILLSARDRWSADSRLRRMHGCKTDNPDSPEYRKYLDRYVNAVLKTHNDNLPTARPAFQIPAGSDVISAALANPDLIVRE